ncbi:MAG: hypothetical protein ACRYGG_02295 [Janthinobacterium lividum]
MPFLQFGGTFADTNNFKKFLDNIHLIYELEKLKKDYQYELSIISENFYSTFVKHYNKNFKEIEPAIPQNLVDISILLSTVNNTFNILEQLLLNKLFKFQAILTLNKDNSLYTHIEKSVSFAQDLDLNQFKL